MILCRQVKEMNIIVWMEIVFRYGSAVAVLVEYNYLNRV